MKAFTTILTISLTTSLTWGQADTVFIKYNKDKYEEQPNYKVDTVIFATPNARKILYGTTVLPWSYNQQVAKGYGLYLDSVSMTPCKQELGYIPDMNSQVMTVKHDKDNLTIEIKYWGNCCHSFLCDIEVKDENVINLIIHGYGATYCSCDCCFGLTYNLTRMDVDTFDSLKFITINGDNKTMKPLK